MKYRLFTGLAGLTLAALTVLAPAALVAADGIYQGFPFAQDWTATDLITVSGDWSGVPGILGYRGDYTSSTPAGVDPQTLLADYASTTVDVVANQSNPNTLATGGVAEFEMADPVVALQGSGTADAPFVLLHIDATGKRDIAVSYDLRDIDGSGDDAIQPVALHFRVGGSGNFVNVPAAFVADATTGPSLATMVTSVTAMLPVAADNQALLELRIMTANAVGNDEWVGVDNISVTDTTLAVTLVEFSASQQADAILVTWETASELDNRGFNLYRGTSPAGPDHQLNTTLIPSQSQGSPSGFVYTWEDRADLEPGTTYYYWLEDLDISGATTLHGPVSATAQAPTGVTLSGISASPAAGSMPAAGVLLALFAPLAGAVWTLRHRL
jgi:hypothetical protein